MRNRRAGGKRVSRQSAVGEDIIREGEAAETYISERRVLAEDSRPPEHDERQLGHLRAPDAYYESAGSTRAFDPR